MLGVLRGTHPIAVIT